MQRWLGPLSGTVLVAGVYFAILYFTGSITKIETLATAGDRAEFEWGAMACPSKEVLERQSDLSIAQRDEESKEVARAGKCVWIDDPVDVVKIEEDHACVRPLGHQGDCLWAGRLSLLKR